MSSINYMNDEQNIDEQSQKIKKKNKTYCRCPHSDHKRQSISRENNV